MSDDESPRSLIWLGDSKAAFMGFPRTVQREMGYALFLAQLGARHLTMAKTLKGFTGGSVVEVLENDEQGAFRAVYTLHYLDSVYVLHAFQKKSKAGAKTPKSDIDLIRQRLKALMRERERQ